VVLCADDILKQYSLLYRHSVNALSSASLGKRSDYDGEMLARMGVYSRVTGGYARVSAATSLEAPATAEQPVRQEKKTTRKTAPAPKSEKVEQPMPPKSEPCQADHSAQALASLGERERRVFEAIPMEHPLAIDRLQSLGYSTGELLAALSLLEIKGLIQTLPGGLYCRA
jgi:hypothetical protein